MFFLYILNPDIPAPYKEIDDSASKELQTTDAPASKEVQPVDNLDIDDSASKACVSPGKAYIMVVAPVLLLASKLW